MGLLKPIAAIAALSIAFLYVVGVATSSEDEVANETPRPDIEFDVINDDSDQYRRRIEVALDRPISEDQLTSIAEYLVEDGASNTLIGYRIEGDSDYGYWATTNYNPDLNIRILGTASELGTDMENQSASKDAGEISREEYGEDWPFTVDSGRLECWRGPSAVFITGGKVYQLNGMARQMGHAPLEPIWRDNPDIPGTKINIGPVMQRALRLCD